VGAGVAQDVVDYFVIGESNYSQVGVAKRLHFWESRYRFQQFWPKIKHLVFYEGDVQPIRIETCCTMNRVTDNLPCRQPTAWLLV
jgi:hypothetical protein